MTKNDHLRPKNVIFERFWPFSKFHFLACSTLVIGYNNVKIFDKAGENNVS